MVAMQCERFPEKAGEFVRGKQASLRVVPKGDELASKLNVRVLPAVIGPPPVTRVSSQATTSTSVRAWTARRVMSARLPMGVAMR